MSQYGAEIFWVFFTSGDGLWVQIIFKGTGRVTNEDDALDTDYYKSIDIGAEHIAVRRGEVG